MTTYPLTRTDVRARAEQILELHGRTPALAREAADDLTDEVLDAVAQGTSDSAGWCAYEVLRMRRAMRGREGA